MKFLIGTEHFFYWTLYSFFAEREMERRKYESRNELEMRREDRRRRGKKRSATPEELSNKKSRNQHSPNTKYEEEVVTLLSESDVEDRKSDSPNSEPEEGNNIKIAL